MSSEPLRKRCFNHFSEIRVGKCHVITLYLSITCFNNYLCNVFDMIVDWTFFFRSRSTVCFYPVMIHLSNYDNETGRSNPEKLPSNFQFWCFGIWLRIFFFAVSKIVVKSSKFFLCVSMAFAWQSAEQSCLDKCRAGGLENILRDLFYLKVFLDIAFSWSHNHFWEKFCKFYLSCSLRVCSHHLHFV